MKTGGFGIGCHHPNSTHFIQNNSHSRFIKKKKLSEIERGKSPISLFFSNKKKVKIYF